MGVQGRGAGRRLEAGEGICVAEKADSYSEVTETFTFSPQAHQSGATAKEYY